MAPVQSRERGARGKRGAEDPRCNIPSPRDDERQASPASASSGRNNSARVFSPSSSPLPTRLDRYAVDAHYSDLVNTLRAGGSPAAVAEQAHQQFLSQFRTAHPQVEIPTYLRNLGHDEEAPNATQQAPSIPSKPHRHNNARNKPRRRN